MIKIGIDPSINSTAVCISSNDSNILFNYTTVKSNNYWVKQTNDMIHYRHYDKVPTDMEYSMEQIVKLKQYDIITTDIVNDIKQNIKNFFEISITIEGFSYSSVSGHLIDLVTFSTLLRIKLLSISTNILIIDPKSLKKSTSILVYGWQIIKNKEVTMNNNGVKGGDFTKNDMMSAIFDSEIKSPIYDFCIKNKYAFLNKTIPKPFDDINDAVLLTKLYQ